jgi:hypothetical protein
MIFTTLIIALLPDESHHHDAGRLCPVSSVLGQSFTQALLTLPAPGQPRSATATTGASSPTVACAGAVSTQTSSLWRNLLMLTIKSKVKQEFDSR